MNKSEKNKSVQCCSTKAEVENSRQKDSTFENSSRFGGQIPAALSFSLNVIFIEIRAVEAA